MRRDGEEEEREECRMKRGNKKREQIERGKKVRKKAENDRSTGTMNTDGEDREGRD